MGNKLSAGMQGGESLQGRSTMEKNGKVKAFWEQGRQKTRKRKERRGQINGDSIRCRREGLLIGKMAYSKSRNTPRVNKS